jgi:hypothetical protein
VRRRLRVALAVSVAVLAAWSSTVVTGFASYTVDAAAGDPYFDHTIDPSAPCWWAPLGNAGPDHNPGTVDPGFGSIGPLSGGTGPSTVGSTGNGCNNGQAGGLHGGNGMDSDTVTAGSGPWLHVAGPFPGDTLYPGAVGFVYGDTGGKRDDNQGGPHAYIKPDNYPQNPIFHTSINGGDGMVSMWMAPISTASQLVIIYSAQNCYDYNSYTVQPCGSNSLALYTNDNFGHVCLEQGEGDVGTGGPTAARPGHDGCWAATNVLNNWNLVTLRIDNSACRASLWWDYSEVGEVTTDCSYGSGGNDNRAILEPHSLHESFSAAAYGLTWWRPTQAANVLLNCGDTGALCDSTEQRACQAAGYTCNYLYNIFNGTGSGLTRGQGTSGGAGGGGACGAGSSPGILSGECKFQFGGLVYDDCSNFDTGWNVGQDIQWLGCWIVNGLKFVANIGVNIANGFVDLIMPGDQFSAPWSALWTNATGRVPFQWVGASYGVVSGAFGAAAQNPSFSSDVPLGGGHTFHLAIDVGQLLSPLASFRSIISGFLVLGAAAQIYRGIRARLNPAANETPLAL